MGDNESPLESKENGSGFLLPAKNKHSPDLVAIIKGQWPYRLVAIRAMRILHEL